MSATFTVSPDFGPDKIGSWFVFNTWLQQQVGIAMHVDLFTTFAEQRAAIEAGRIDLIYANPYDAQLLVREHGFRAVARPLQKADEVVLAAAAERGISHVEELRSGTRIAATDDPDVSMIGRIMLEPADLDATNTTTQLCDTYVLVAKALLTGQADVGMFLHEAFQNLSGFVRSQLQPLVTSQISVIHHCLLVGPRLLDARASIGAALANMHAEPKGAAILAELGIGGFGPMEHEEVEFLIDLMDTLAA